MKLELLAWLAGFAAVAVFFVALSIVSSPSRRRRVEAATQVEAETAPPPTIINGVEVDLTLMTGIRVDVGDFFAGVVLPVAHCPGHYVALCGPDMFTDGTEYDDRLAAVTKVVKTHQSSMILAEAMRTIVEQNKQAAAGTEVTTP